MRLMAVKSLNVIDAFFIFLFVKKFLERSANFSLSDSL